MSEIDREKSSQDNSSSSKGGFWWSKQSSTKKRGFFGRVFDKVLWFMSLDDEEDYFDDDPDEDSSHQDDYKFYQINFLDFKELSDGTIIFRIINDNDKHKGFAFLFPAGNHLLMIRPDKKDCADSCKEFMEEQLDKIHAARKAEVQHGD